MQKLLFMLLTTCSLSLAAQSLKVMTYNIRYHNHSDGVNGWNHRKEKVVELILKSNPDVLGVQEALHSQMKDLCKLLKDYAYVGVGREDGKEKGEYVAIFYKKSRLKVVKSGSFWLSETPETPGSMGWDAACTRMATWAEFEELNTKKQFLVASAHLDHVGTQARLQSMFKLKTWFSAYPSKKPSILCGDFNFEPTEEPYQAFFSQEENWKDTRPAANKQGTYCGFEKGKMECKTIDYVFVSNEWKAENFDVPQDNNGTYYPSDHLPVVVTISLQP
ncbi:MAG: endonuclease/exonuclease/phosphatase family protein [Bacteroidota bacterium]